MYITINEIKKHLNIDSGFIDDDNYLLTLESVAEATVQKHINQKLSDVVAENGDDLPSPLKLAMLLLIGNLYQNRESFSYSSVSEIPLSYSYLLDLYKNYNNENMDV